MALPVLPSTSNFLAVALVINRSRDGPRFVFHYPPNVLPAHDSTGHNPSRGGDDADVDDDDDNNLLGRSSRHASLETPASSVPHAAELLQWNHDDHLVTESGTQIVPWEHVAGFPTKDLENILTPARAYHKKLFQVSLDPLVCVSYPVYVPENGVWRKKRKPQKQPDPTTPGRRDDDEPPAQTDTDGAPRNGDRKVSDVDQVDVRDMAPRPPAKTVEEAEDKKSSMTMFNLVFILNPKKHESKDLVDIMFTHIIKKINKAYKYCQQRSDFVWKESKKILALKDKAREDRKKMSVLWEEILSSSTLAASMQDLYAAVSRNRIAALQLHTVGGLVTHSVQIPVPFHLSDLPPDGGEGQRGLWLTTANTIVNDDVDEEPDYLDKNFALLLLADEKKIVTELQSDPDETTLAMVEFVRHCKATLSFHQVGQQSANVLTQAQVRKFAQHFIFWRRGIAIPPLHGRDMYIVSPNCDLRKLPEAGAKWARQFPLSPPLPNFLAELSMAPRPYKLHCPSKAHRPVYMTMLAWLMRGGWVTQLCTFAYVVVWPEIVYEVEYSLEAEDIARAKRESQERNRDKRASESSSSTLSSADVAALSDAPVDAILSGSGFLPLLDDMSDPSSSTATLRDLSLLHSPSLARVSQSQQFPPRAASDLDDSEFSPTSPNTIPSRHGPESPLSRTATPLLHDPSQPTPAEQAAEKARLERIADKAARELMDRATAHARKVIPEQTAHPSVNNARHLAGMSPHIILDAKKATGKESLYLSAIGHRLRESAATGGGSPAARRNSAVGNARGHHHHLHQPHHGPSIGRFDQADRDRIGRDKGGASDNMREWREWDERVANAWPMFWRYFNGRSALERIALQEDMKRKDAWNLLTAMSEYLLCIRHW
ncbi:nitrogen permease regulator of amino acid transport activity 3-domain-containing protein [Podospora appendiculata]|uniref:Nitrogen permease regulator 3 n=1 Tax=Podospora appendiculata TaxID=314037 RepID=A0AAE0XKK0_9PEZI|nr:nitrogen permease regulator of amino acid transport activity 3-domain-containing protein [Podospora appendiculata]